MLRLEKRHHINSRFNVVGPLLALGLTGLVAGGIFFALGLHPGRTLTAFFIAPVQNPVGFAEWLLKAAPMIIIALGLTFCFKANQWNIGAEGQFVLGAIGAGSTALALQNVDSIWVIVWVILAGVLSGMLWAGLCAFLKAQLKTNEILSSLMLSYVAVQLLSYLVYGPLKDPDGFGFPESALFSEQTTLHILWAGTRLHSGVLWVPALLLISWVLLSKHQLGYRVKLTGYSPVAARYAGFSQKGLIWLVFLISGACAGLAGALEVTGMVGQLTPGLSLGYGFTAIIVAFLGRLNPFAIVLAGLVIALTYLGGEALQIADINTLKRVDAQAVSSIPKAVGEVFQGMILLGLLMSEILRTHRVIWKSSPNKAQSKVQNISAANTPTAPIKTGKIK